ncbi:MAG: glucose-6-phosphate dehydrogenase [Candidatus Bathyarchaeota archaeon]|nr:glucose-6-phosphate dehydrogenase [Candidatus Bathyarchaeota archaeon]
MSTPDLEPTLFIIFGATGDLTKRKLLPALYNIFSHGERRDNSVILGVARRPLSEEDFRNQARSSLEANGVSDDHYTSWCEQSLYYQSIHGGTAHDYEVLTKRILGLEQKHELPGNRVFNLALPPAALSKTLASLGQQCLNTSSGWTRLVLEKPFGHDLKSAKNLNQLVHRYYDETQIYRIDHYLGKETVQNLLIFRFANAFFEHLWNREHIESVELTVAETVGIEGRSYYDQTGALRDMVQNHLTQLLTLIAMESPASFQASDIRNEKVKVLRQTLPIQTQDVIFGQYSEGDIDGQRVNDYQNESGVSSNSTTETFVSVKLEIANWRWKGVPFYLRTGKRLPRKITQIIVNFHCAPVSLFEPLNSSCPIEPNAIIITLQPNEGFDLQFQVKTIGQPITLSTQRLHFRYAETFGELPDAYETLLQSVILGDQTLFVRYDEVETAWQIYDQLITIKNPLHTYPAGTWGPVEARRYYSPTYSKTISDA